MSDAAQPGPQKNEVRIVVPTAAPQSTGVRLSVSRAHHAAATPATPAESRTLDGSENLPDFVWMLMTLTDEVEKKGFSRLFGKSTLVQATVCMEARKENGEWSVRLLDDDGKGGYTKERTPPTKYGTVGMVEQLAGPWEKFKNLPGNQGDNPAIYGNWLAAYQANLAALQQNHRPGEVIVAKPALKIA